MDSTLSNMSGHQSVQLLSKKSKSEQIAILTNIEPQGGDCRSNPCQNSLLGSVYLNVGVFTCVGGRNMSELPTRFGLLNGVLTNPFPGVCIGVLLFDFANRVVGPTRGFVKGLGVLIWVPKCTLF